MIKNEKKKAYSFNKKTACSNFCSLSDYNFEYKIFNIYFKDKKKYW